MTDEGGVPQTRTIGLFGYGQFGAFFAPCLAQLGAVTIYDPHVTSRQELGVGIRSVTTPEEAAAADILMFAVPLGQLDALASRIKNIVPASSLLLDVTSVKMKPLSILRTHFPNHQILGTHPIFGPQSGKNGIEGLPIVLCNESWKPENYEWLKNALANTLKLNVIEKTAEEHDREMAYVQGLSHLIGRALSQMNIPAVESITTSYAHLIELRDILKDDTWELFETIQNGNPFVKTVREEFEQKITELEDKFHS